jgi:hypothetical protein
MFLLTDGVLETCLFYAVFLRITGIQRQTISTGIRNRFKNLNSENSQQILNIQYSQNSITQILNILSSDG